MSNPPPIPFTDRDETPPETEGRDIDQVLEALMGMLRRNLAESGQRRGDVHVKSHGYALGELRVLAGLPTSLAQGLFDTPAAHRAIVRFSSGSGMPQADLVPDGRGMAIKLLNVPGQRLPLQDPLGSTQDFVMINAPAFFVRNVHDYLRLQQALASSENSLERASQAVTGGSWNPLEWHWREMLHIAGIALQVPKTPSATRYFSMVPIRYGGFVAKYRVQPAGDPSQPSLLPSVISEADAMRLSLEQQLRERELQFDFQIQLRTGVDSMPIEDATVEWPEAESPYQTVAELRLPQQDIAGLQEQREFQRLAFNVWHGVTDHRPLGGINRVRRLVYETSAKWRNGELQ